MDLFVLATWNAFIRLCRALEGGLERHCNDRIASALLCCLPVRGSLLPQISPHIIASQVDMHSSNPFVVGLSLTTVGNLATPDIARDLMMEVEKHLRGGRPYLMKKVGNLTLSCTVRLSFDFDDDDQR